MLELPETAARPLVIAIAYQGVRLGAWWKNDWTDMLLQNVQDVKTKATMLRWFHLPILSDLSRAKVRQFVERSGSFILPIWLSDTPEVLFSCDPEDTGSVECEDFRPEKADRSYLV